MTPRVFDVFMHDDIDLVSLRVLARRLRVPAEWLRAEAEGNRLPAVKAHDALLFHYPTVVRILAERASSLSAAPREAAHG